jgi:NADH-quinone oxidoreductase subunit L
MMNPQDLLKAAWLVSFLPFAAFLVIVFTALGKRKIAPVLSIGAIFASFVLSAMLLVMRLFDPGAPPMEVTYPWVALTGGWRLELAILVDNLSAAMLAMVTFVAFLIQLYSTGYMEHEGDGPYTRYFAFMSLFAASMLGLVISGNLLGTYICWELVGLSSYLLIGFWYERKSAAAAAKKAFVVTRFGDLGFLFGIVLITWGAGTQRYTDLLVLFANADVPPMIVTVAALLIFSGAAGKSAQFPLHVWLPDAMEGPTPVSALIHAATMVAAGVFLVARTYFIFQVSPVALETVAAIGAATLLIAGTIALVQRDIKRVLAYSTISQLGYMMLALGAAGLASGHGAAGYGAGIFHLLTHAFFKALLFLCAGAVIHSLGTNDLMRMGGLARRMPWTHLAFLAGCLAITGIPPFSGFFSKEEILASALAAGSLPLIAAAYTGVAITAFYMFRLYALAFLGDARSDEARRAADMRLNITAPIVILAVLSIFSGFPVGRVMSFIGGSVQAHAGLIPALAGLALAAAGALGALLIYGRKPSDDAVSSRLGVVWKFLEDKWYLDHFWEWIVRKIIFASGRILAFIDEYGIDGIVRGIAALVGMMGDAVRVRHNGQVQRYLLVLFLGLLAVILIAYLSSPFSPPEKGATRHIHISGHAGQGEIRP